MRGRHKKPTTSQSLRYDEPEDDEQGKKIGVLLVLVVFMAGLLGTIGYRGYRLLEGSDFFQLTSIKIEGYHHLSKAKVLELSGVDIHTNLFALEGRQVRRRLENYPWIAKAEVEKNWPNRLLIRIQERVPVAMLNTAAGFYFLDKTGIAFGLAQPPEELDFPVVSGEDGEAWAMKLGVKGSGNLKELAPELADALAFLACIGMGSSSLPNQNVSEIHLSKEQGVMLFLADRPFPIYLGRGEMKNKFLQLAKVLHSLYKKDDFATTTYIRMDNRQGKVVVGKQGAV